MHTPYDGSSKLFQIGLKPLDLADWIYADERLAADLAEKERLAATRWDEVFAAEPGTEAAQAEVLALLVAHLPARYPNLYSRDGSDMVAEVLDLSSCCTCNNLGIDDDSFPLALCSAHHCPITGVRDC